MTPARDSKQLSLGALWEEAPGGGIMEEASCRRHHAGGIWKEHLEEASWEEASWTSGRHLEVSGRHLEASGRHLETSGRHLDPSHPSILYLMKNILVLRLLCRTMRFVPDVLKSTLLGENVLSLSPCFSKCTEQLFAQARWFCVSRASG